MNRPPKRLNILFNHRNQRTFILELKFSDLCLQSMQLQQDLAVARRSLQEVAAVQAAARPQRIVFEYFHLSPLKVGTHNIVTIKFYTVTYKKISAYD